MTNLTHKPCPYVDCGSTDAFSWDDDKGCGKCHSCGKGYPSRKWPRFDWASEEYPTHHTTREDAEWLGEAERLASMEEELFWVEDQIAKGYLYEPNF